MVEIYGSPYMNFQYAKGMVDLGHISDHMDIINVEKFQVCKSALSME